MDQHIGMSVLPILIKNEGERQSRRLTTSPSQVSVPSIKCKFDYQKIFRIAMGQLARDQFVTDQLEKIPLLEVQSVNLSECLHRENNGGLRRQNNGLMRLFYKGSV